MFFRYFIRSSEGKRAGVYTHISRFIIRNHAFVFRYNTNKYLRAMNNGFPWMYIYEYGCLSYFKNEDFILKIVMLHDHIVFTP